jgi:hypothetical protein
MHTMVTEFHQVGPLLPPEPSVPLNPELNPELNPAGEDPGSGERPGSEAVQDVPALDEKRPSERLLLQVNTFLVEHRWSPEVVKVQFVVTPLPGGSEALHQILVTHPAVAT